MSTIYCGKTARERLPEDIQYIMAEIEADDILERTQSGKRGVITAGRFLGLGKAPYGYRKEGKGKELVILIESEQAAVVVLIFDWYVFGEDETPPMNTQQIADRLTAIGIATPMDLLPDRAHLKQRQERVWERNAVYRILRESSYNGYFTQFKKKREFNTNFSGYIIPHC